MCQLGDEVRKKEGKLDSIGLTSQNFEHTHIRCYKSQSYALLIVMRFYSY